MLVILACVIVFHIICAALLFTSTVNNVSSCSHGAAETTEQGGERGGCGCDLWVSSPGLGALILGTDGTLGASSAQLWLRLAWASWCDACLPAVLLSVVLSLSTIAIQS